MTDSHLTQMMKNENQMFLQELVKHIMEISQHLLKIESTTFSRNCSSVNSSLTTDGAATEFNETPANARRECGEHQRT